METKKTARLGWACFLLIPLLLAISGCLTDDQPPDASTPEVQTFTIDQEFCEYESGDIRVRGCGQLVASFDLLDESSPTVEFEENLTGVSLVFRVGIASTGAATIDLAFDGHEFQSQFVAGEFVPADPSDGPYPRQQNDSDLSQSFRFFADTCDIRTLGIQTEAIGPLERLDVGVYIHRPTGNISVKALFDEPSCRGQYEGAGLETPLFDTARRAQVPLPTNRFG